MSTDSAAPIRFGLIGVDSPHAPSFTRLFGNGFDGVVPGGTVTHAWKGVPASDFPLSRDRNDDFAAQVAALGVTLCDSPEAVAEACDALLIVAADTRTHPEYFRRVVEFGKPIYVDTRFALSLADAKRMLELAGASGSLVLTGSPKRFTPEFRAVQSRGPARQISLTGPMPTQPGHPGLAWYGVHLIDLAVASLGPAAGPSGTVTVHSHKTANPAGTTDVTISWEDGREATFRGESAWSPLTSGTIKTNERTKSFSIEACPEMLTGLLTNIVESIRADKPNLPADEVLSIVALIEAANRSIDSGTPVTTGDIRWPC
ncbi:Predicted dehydrogenase [Pseudarthrobacter equi]|uniref:Predicted dehydrogenase n=1 Tax=Pseudarthrobacter equi TaxID=728066 RepID=A0A1H1YLQ4_9MICC|nr:Gfo/Idh/MocA family oxidoreductase [Pseudarthrobacter equi]SDT22342.1 Predicted dehydrogenase [Pseudarthrobacter equi]